jgi:D-glycero-alpha-D-manno-heptose-7-phosphate kinase
MEFYKDDRVIVNPLRIRQDILAELESSMVLFYTGVSRDSEIIIRDQIQSAKKSDINLDAMKGIKEQAFVMKELILKGNIKEFAEHLHHSWMLKKQTSTKVSNSEIDRIYDSVMENGAIAGKVSGAGGGGFMMFIVEPTRKLDVVRTLEKEQGRVLACQFSTSGAVAWHASRMVS